MSTVLLRTIHGSRLYGLDHENSDRDYYEVYSGKGRAKQDIVGDTDTLRISLDSFMYQCRKGVPQALEALYSTMKEVNDIPFIVDTFNPMCIEVYKTYLRTITNFWANTDVKRKRHAIRLCLNLSDIMKYGRFDPTLSEYQKCIVTSMGSATEEDCPGLSPLVLGFHTYKW